MRRSRLAKPTSPAQASWASTEAIRVEAEPERRAADPARAIPSDNRAWMELLDSLHTEQRVALPDRGGPERRHGQGSVQAGRRTTAAHARVRHHDSVDVRTRGRPLRIALRDRCCRRVPVEGKYGTPDPPTTAVPETARHPGMPGRFVLRLCHSASSHLSRPALCWVSSGSHGSENVMRVEDIWELGTDHRWHFRWWSPRAYWYLGRALRRERGAARRQLIGR
jgi:hypothetical protein